MSRQDCAQRYAALNPTCRPSNLLHQNIRRSNHGSRTQGQAEEGAAKLFSRIDHLDILVNNLGIFETRPFLEIDDADWRRFFEVNVLSGVRTTRHYLPRMLEKKWGRVLFISSESGLQIPAEMVHYGMTKTAQLAVARGIAESFPASG
ncbi:MAG: SDR family oxidoreductase, partial [Silvibacterium sp.]|nr:SDR family oxidoreductase [Silvibacterium sp.]